MLLSVFLILSVGWCPLVRGAGETRQDYLDQAMQELKTAKNVVFNYNLAKNVILAIGDGMGLSTVTTGRIYKGQTLGQSGEEYKLSFETFPAVGLAKTYNSDSQVADSAGTATAMMGGVKANMGTLGVDSSMPNGNSCKGYTTAKNVESILDYALEEGKSVGLVTTTRVTHATPGAAYAHTPQRYWENDAEMKDAVDCGMMKDIARQLIEDNPGVQVILGGGRRNFYNVSEGGRRLDNRKLVKMWEEDRKKRSQTFAYVETKGEFDKINPQDVDSLFGLFAWSHMSYELDRDNSSNGQPSLTEMALKAIEILSKNPKGYFLLVEGGRIDHAHHDNEAKKALAELAEFDQTVAAMKKVTPDDETLMVVTADHSHVFTMAGYPTRGNNILGLVDRYGQGEEPTDGMPYTTLAYTNGPEAKRENLTNVDTSAKSFKFPGCVEMAWETHGGEDVGIYAIGPMAHLIHTTHEQQYIAHVMMYASCIGYYDTDEKCDLQERRHKALNAATTTATATLLLVPLSLVASLWVFRL